MSSLAGTLLFSIFAGAAFGAMVGFCGEFAPKNPFIVIPFMLPFFAAMGLVLWYFFFPVSVGG